MKSPFFIHARDAGARLQQAEVNDDGEIQLDRLAVLHRRRVLPSLDRRHRGLGETTPSRIDSYGPQSPDRAVLEDSGHEDDPPALPLLSGPGRIQWLHLG